MKVCMVAHFCHPTAPVERREAEMGESLEACGTAILVCTAGNKKALSQTMLMKTVTQYGR